MLSTLKDSSIDMLSRCPLVVLMSVNMQAIVF